VFVHEHCDVAMMTLRPECLGEHGHRAASEAELDDQRKNLQLRRWDAIELRKALLVVALAGELPSDAVPNSAAICTEVAHEPQATDATAGIASEINEKSSTREIRNCAADVPGDVDSKDAREHAYAHITDVRIELARTDDLIGHHDRPLLLTRTWNFE